LKYIITSFIACFFIYSCSKSYIDTLLVTFENIEYDLDQATEKNQLIKTLLKEQIIPLTGIRDIVAKQHSFKNGEYILITGKGENRNGDLIPFTVPFEKKLLKNGSVSTEFSSCTMMCNASGCDQCRQEVINPCAEQWCSCFSGGGDCSPYIEYH